MVADSPCLGSFRFWQRQADLCPLTKPLPIDAGPNRTGRDSARLEGHASVRSPRSGASEPEELLPQRRLVLLLRRLGHPANLFFLEVSLLPLINLRHGLALRRQHLFVAYC